MSDRGDQTVRNPHIVITQVGRYAGSAWMCDNCGQRGMSLSGGPSPTQLRYALEKHVCRPDRLLKRRECNA